MNTKPKKSVISFELAAIAKDFSLTEGEAFTYLPLNVKETNKSSSGFDLKDLSINPTKTTPRVEFKNNGEFWMTGSCISLDFKSFFSPIANWLKEYLLRPAECTHINIKLRYISPDDLKGLVHNLF